MVRDRFIHIMGVTAIASGVLAAVSVARAEGGGDDRIQMYSGASESGRSQNQNQNQSAAVEEPVPHRPLAPLPPRRPKGLEAVADAPVSEPPPSSLPSPVQANVPPQPAQAGSASQPYQRVGNTTVFKLSAQPLAAEQPLPSEQFGSARRDPPKEPEKPSAGGTNLSTITISQPAAAAATISPPAEPAPEPAATVTARVPLPPLRPKGLDQDGARIEQASLQTPSWQQPSPPPSASAYSAPPGDNGGNSPGFFQRMFSAPPGRVNEAVSGEPSQPRAMSRLNHIIGDDPARAGQLKALIAKHAAANGLPFKFADAVVRVESRYNARARNGPYIGLMQIHPRTAASLGYGGDASGLFDPDTNLQYGIKYLAMAYRLANGDTCGTIMRYQGGHRAVSMTSANRTYCNKVKMIFGENLN